MARTSSSRSHLYKNCCRRGWSRSSKGSLRKYGVVLGIGSGEVQMNLLIAYLSQTDCQRQSIGLVRPVANSSRAHKGASEATRAARDQGRGRAAQRIYQWSYHLLFNVGWVIFYVISSHLLEQRSQRVGRRHLHRFRPRRIETRPRRQFGSLGDTNRHYEAKSDHDRRLHSTFD